MAREGSLGLLRGGAYAIGLDVEGVAPVEIYEAGCDPYWYYEQC